MAVNSFAVIPLRCKILYQNLWKVKSSWNGGFVAHPSTAEADTCDFFGMPSKGPFYVAAGGMHNFPLHLVDALPKKWKGKYSHKCTCCMEDIKAAVQKLGSGIWKVLGGTLHFTIQKRVLRNAQRIIF